MIGHKIAQCLEKENNLYGTTRKTIGPEKLGLKTSKLIKIDFDEAYKKVDAILTPSTPSSAFKIGEKKDDPVSMYLNDIFTVPVNLAGLPGISIPAGHDAKGYPLGLQIIGKAFDEQNILNIAYAMEEKIDFKNKITDWWIKWVKTDQNIWLIEKITNTRL